MLRARKRLYPYPWALPGNCSNRESSVLLMNIVNTVKAFGCHDVVLLDDTPNPKHLDYLDLLKVSGRENLKVDAVAEFQSRPLLYIASADQKRKFDNKNRLDLQCLLANRGERAYLAVFEPR